MRGWIYGTPSSRDRPDCQCWRDTLCRHKDGWTWDPINWDDSPCEHHTWAFLPDVFISFADMLRDAEFVSGSLTADQRGRVLFGWTADRTRVIEAFVMPKGMPDSAFVDDHDVEGSEWTPLLYAHYTDIVPRGNVRKEMIR